MAGNKIYAEVIADITFDASRQDAEALYRHFAGRKSIETSDFKKITRGRWYFEAVYRVHGGWASDFVKKIEYDAQDAHVEPKNLVITTHRREIPEECPRKECRACSYVLDPSLRLVAPKETKPDTLDKRKRRFWNF